MPRTAAGGNAGRDGNYAALRRLFAERVEVRRPGRFERSKVIILLGGDVAESIHDDQYELGACLDCQVRINAIELHKRFRVSEFRKPSEAWISGARDSAFKARERQMKPRLPTETEWGGFPMKDCEAADDESLLTLTRR